MHHLLELGAARKFFQTAPIFRTLRPGDLGASGFEIQLVLLPRTNFLAMLLIVLLFHFLIRTSCGRDVASYVSTVKRPRPVGRARRRSSNTSPVTGRTTGN